MSEENKINTENGQGVANLFELWQKVEPLRAVAHNLYRTFSMSLEIDHKNYYQIHFEFTQNEECYKASIGFFPDDFLEHDPVEEVEKIFKKASDFL